MFKLALFAGLFILLIATSGCLEGPQGPPGESSVDTVYVVDTGGVSGFMYDTVFVCPIDTTTAVYNVELELVPSSWFIVYVEEHYDIGDTTLVLGVYEQPYFTESFQDQEKGFNMRCIMQPAVRVIEFHLYYNP